MIDASIDRKDPEIENRSPNPEGRLADLELSLDELSYVSGGKAWAGSEAYLKYQLDD
jgi:hypothetical protein